jgi:guanylate kinase
MLAGRLFVISAPSGAGKTSLVHALLKARPTLRVSISHTTRPARASELPGREYFFVTVPEFQQLIAAHAFLEHARVFDNYYGTSRAQLRSTLEAGHDVVLEIDWQGARQVRAAMPATSIFILPPSRAALAARLQARGTDSETVITRRLRDAADDISHCTDFDYAVVNEQFDQALAELCAIMDGKGAALRADRPAVAPLLAALVA